MEINQLNENKDFFKSIKKSIYQIVLEANQGNLDSIAFDIRTSANNYAIGSTITYGEYLNQMNINAKASCVLNIKPNDIVPFILPNIVESRTLIYGHNIIGAISYPISPMAPENQLDQFISENNIKNIFILSKFFDKYKKVLNHNFLENIICIGDYQPLSQYKKVIPWNEYQKQNTEIKENLIPYYEEDHTAVIIGTSGTTGVSKGTCITNENLNVAAMSYKKGNVFPGSFMDALIPSIAYGMVMLHLQAVDRKKVYLIPELLTDKTARALCAIKPDVFAGGPVHYINIKDSDEFRNGKMPPRKIYLSGGASLDPDVENTLNGVKKGYVEEENINESLIVRQGYALTETSGLGTIAKRGFYKFGSIGIPMLYTEIAIFEPDTENKLGPNENGEICITGPSVVKEYYNNPVETNKTFKIHKDGKKWLHTKDIGYIDEDGYIFHVDRIKNIFMRFGFNVHPNNIANFINSISYVKNVAVIGFPHPIEQNVPVAFIELEPCLDKSQEEILKEIINECYSNLEETSIPLDYILVDSIPINVGGKVDSELLRRASKIDYFKQERASVREVKLK